MCASMGGAGVPPTCIMHLEQLVTYVEDLTIQEVCRVSMEHELPLG